MPIQAQAADNTIHEFPDGTSPAVIDKVMREYAQSNAPKEDKPAPSSVIDAVRSIPGGVAKGVAGVVGLPGDIANLADKGMDYLTGGNVSAHRVPGRIDSQQVNDVISAPTGGYYQPQTTAGKYAETIASLAPAAAMPGSIPARIARVVIPGTASETGGEAFQGTEYEPYARIAGALVGGLAAGPAIRSINVLSSRVGVPLEDPNIAARSMLSDAVRRDGGTGAVQDNLNAWRGNSAPALIDVTGNNVRRLVRSAASGGRGEAQNVATTYANRIAGNLQDNSLALTRNLSPVTNSAENYGNLLEDLQREDAQFNYRQPYSEPASVTPDMVSALQGPEGRGAINRAYAAARANRDHQQMAELQDLRAVASEQAGGADPITGQRRTIQQALEGVSAGSLDRVRIAMRETGNGLAARGARDMARGYAGRVNDIDTALDQTPGLQDARASYADYARQREALDLGQTGFNAAPEDYAASIARLAQASPQAGQAAGVGYRQALTNAISRPAEGATGVLNRIATSDAQSRNLAATFGNQAAQDYQTGIGNEVSRVANSRFISPNTGSQTEPRLQDAGLLDIPVSKAGLIGHVWDKIKSSAQLTEQERTALVRMGTTEARLRDLARANPSLTSRALTTALLGNRSSRN